MKRGILRLLAVVVSAAVSVVGGANAADASVDRQTARQKSEFQQRIKSLQGTPKPRDTLGDRSRQVQWYNWNNWQNWGNWGNWPNW